MKLYKLKFLLMVVCCAVTGMWAEIQCAEETNQERENDYKARVALNQFSARVKRNENLGARSGSMISQQDLLREELKIRDQQRFREQEQQNVQEIAEYVMRTYLVRDGLYTLPSTGILQIINVPEPIKVCDCNRALALSFRSKIQSQLVDIPSIKTGQGERCISFRFVQNNDGKHIDF